MCSSNKSTPVAPKKVVNYRLPRDLKPRFYEILIKPLFNVTTKPEVYFGNVLVKVECKKSSYKLVLHSHSSIEIDPSSFEVSSSSIPNFNKIKGLNDNRRFVRKWWYDNETDFLTVEFQNEIFKAGANYSISFGFTGKLDDSNAGFYRSSYLDNNGNRRWLLASQMEPVDARKSFPCFDEPDMKAVFKLRIIHDSSVHALSNMPIKSSANLYSFKILKHIKLSIINNPSLKKEYH